MNIVERYFQLLEDTFAEQILTMKSKASDYSKDSDPFSNFRFAAQAAGVTVNQVFLVMEGIKIARLENLLNSGKPPQNESIADTLKDLMGYAAAHKGYLELANSSDPTFAYGDAAQAQVEAEIEAVIEPAESKLKKLLKLVPTKAA